MSRLRWMFSGLVAATAAVLIALIAGPQGRDQAAVAERQPAASRGSDAIPGRYIVTFERSVDSASGETARREKEQGFRARFVYGRAVKGFSASLSDRQVARLKADPEVTSVTPDRKVRATADLAAGEPDPPLGVRRIGAASGNSVRSQSDVNVAVIDSGVDLSHPDLNATTGKDCVTSGGSAGDENGHGTHVAGTIAGKNNGEGVVGVAPGTRVFAAKVLDASGGGTTSQVICGIDWVTSTRSDSDPSNDIAVANMSLGGSGSPVKTCSTTTDPEHKAICNSTAAGVTYVVAAGNSGWDFDYATQPDTPAAYPEALTVAAMGDSDGQPGGTGAAPVCRTGEADDRYASFSNYAATAAGAAHTIAAPGVCVRSTAPGGGYQTMSGTSMATPHVAGAVALCLDEAGADGPCAGLSPAGIVERMRTEAQRQASADTTYGFSGDPEHPVSGRFFGYLTWAGAPASDTQAPTVSSVSPGDGATAVPTSTGVSVAFSEPMNHAATEAAFSLARSSDGARVSGAFSWNGNTVTFKPSSALAGGTGYTAKVSTGARDAAGNALAGDRISSFKTVQTVTGYPSATVIQAGTLRGGGYSSLRTDDNAYYSVNSTTSGTRTTAWYGRVTGVSNALKSLRAAYKGKNSASCSQTLALWRWTTSSWVTLDSRSVSTTEVQLDATPGGTLADYVSGTSGDGEVRMQVRCTRSSSGFYSAGDLMKVTHERP